MTKSHCLCRHAALALRAALAALAALSGCADYSSGNTTEVCQDVAGGHQAITGQSAIAIRSFKAATGVDCAEPQQRQYRGVPSSRWAQ